METTLILIAVFAGYGIPIYIGVQAWRNGHREWVLALILATFGILGLMGIIVSSRNIEKGDTGVLLSVIAGVACLLAVYIIAWLKTRKLLAVPIECPKCGKPSKARKLVTLDKITGKKVQSRLIGTISLIFGIACVVLVFIGGGLYILIAGIPAIVVGIKAFTSSVIQKVEYKCKACGQITLE